MSVFCKPFTLGRLCSGALDLQDVIQALNDITRLHSDALNLGTSYHLAYDLAWVVTRYHVRVLTPLRAGTYRVCTEPYSFKRMMGYRLYEFYEGDTKVLEGSVQYMLINIKTKAAVHPTAEMIERFDARHADNRTLTFSKFKNTLEIPSNTAQYHIQAKDIDANGHVNNAAYFRYLQAGFNLKQPSEVSVTYKEEVFLNDLIEVKLYRKDNHTLAIIEKEGRVVFECVQT